METASDERPRVRTVAPEQHVVVGSVAATPKLSKLSAEGPLRRRPETPKVAQSTSSSPVWPETQLADRWQSRRIELGPPGRDLVPLWTVGPEVSGRLVGGDRRLYPPQASLRTLPAVKAADRDHKVPPSQRVDLIHINGIETVAEKQFGDMQALANGLSESGGMQAEVRGIHNGTDGLLNDLWRATKDRMGHGTNPPLETVKNKILDRVRAGEPVNLMVHSHGAILAARALREARAALQMEGGHSRDEAEQMLAETVRVVTAASANWDFPDGPRYLHLVNTMDAVAVTLGLGSAPELPPPESGGESLRALGQGLAALGRWVREARSGEKAPVYEPGADHHVLSFETHGGATKDLVFHNHAFRQAYLPKIEAIRAELMGTEAVGGFFLSADQRASWAPTGQVS